MPCYRMENRAMPALNFGVSPSRSLTLFGREIIFEVFQHVQKHTSTSQTDGQTDDLLSHHRTLRSIAR